MLADPDNSAVATEIRHHRPERIARNPLSFGVLAATTAFLAAAGFSLWMALSLAVLGLAYLLLSRRTVSCCGRSLFWASSFPQPSAPSPPRLSSTRLR
jgi:hypothetical protein